MKSVAPKSSAPSTHSIKGTVGGAAARRERGLTVAAGAHRSCVPSGFELGHYYRSPIRKGHRSLLETVPSARSVAKTTFTIPPSNCHRAGHAPSAAGAHPRRAGDPLETYRIGNGPRWFRLNRRARRAPTDRPTLTQSRTARRLAGVRIGESHSHSRVGWAGALEAPSRGRCGMVPFVSVRLEIIAARRLMPLPSRPTKFGTVHLSKCRPSSF